PIVLVHQLNPAPDRIGARAVLGSQRRIPQVKVLSSSRKIMLRGAAAKTAVQTKPRWGEPPREPANQDNQILNPVRPDNVPAKMANSLKTIPKIPANSHPIRTNSKATPIHLSLGVVSNPNGPNNPANSLAKASNLASSLVNGNKPASNRVKAN